MNNITLWYKVKRLQKLSDTNYKEYKKEQKKARAEKKDRDFFAKLNADYGYESQSYDDEIMELNTRYLYSKAQKLLLPIPDYDDDTIWDESHLTGRRNLTNKGVTQLRSAIRKEIHERRIGALLWVAALTGIIGALSGLIAVMSKSL